MSIRTKALFIVFLTFAILCALVTAIATSYLLVAFKDLEKRNLRLTTEHLTVALDAEKERLDLLARDWGSWDELYEFLGSRDPEFIPRYFVKESFVDLRIDCLIIVDASGKIVHGVLYDGAKGVFRPIPASMLPHFAAGSPILCDDSASQGKSGFLDLPEGFMVVAVQPILTNQKKGPARGTILFGSFLQGDMLRRLVGTLKHSLEVYGIQDPGMPEGLRLRLPGLLRGEEAEGQVLGPDAIAGCVLIRDLAGRPAAVFRFVQPRTTFAQGRKALRYTIFSTLVASVIFGVLLFLLLERTLLSRLSHLNEEVTAVGRSGDFSGRVGVTGRDEVASLGGGINGMLSALEASSKELARSEEEHRTLLENLPVGVYRTTPDGRILMVNRALAAMLGFASQEELLARNLESGPFEPGYSRKDFKLWLDETSEIRGLESIWTKRDGTRLHMRENVRAVRGQDGKVAYYEGSVEDITRERRLAQRLQAAKNLETVGMLAGGVAHEVRNPLFSLITLAAVFEKKLSRDPEMRDFLSQLNDQVRRLNAIMNDLLSLGKPVDETLFTPCPVQDVVQEAVGIASQGARDDRAACSLEMPEQPAVVNGDREKLAQAFANLLQNAQHFSPPGETVRVALRVLPGEVRVSVADAGPGIPPELMDHLFLPFSSKRPGGTGMGLALVRKLVVAHGGSVEASNNLPARGATFTVHLPLAEPVRDRPAPPLGGIGDRRW